MTKSWCELLLPYYPKVSNVEELHSTCIANCVFNSFLSLTAILFNIVTIHAIRKTLSLTKTLRTLLVGQFSYGRVRTKPGIVFLLNLLNSFCSNDFPLVVLNSP